MTLAGHWSVSGAVTMIARHWSTHCCIHGAADTRTPSHRLRSIVTWVSSQPWSVSNTEKMLRNIRYAWLAWSNCNILETCWLKEWIKRQNVTIQACDNTISDVWNSARHYKVWKTKTSQKWSVVTALCGEKCMHEERGQHDWVRRKVVMNYQPYNLPLQVPSYRVSIQSSWYQNF